VHRICPPRVRSSSTPVVVHAALRVSWHAEAGVVVLSLWRDRTCAGTFRLGIDEVPDLVDMLRAGLARTYDDARASLVPGMRDAEDLVS